MVGFVYVVYENDTRFLYDNFKSAHEHQQKSNDPMCSIGFISKQLEKQVWYY